MKKFVFLLFAVLTASIASFGQDLTIGTKTAGEMSQIIKEKKVKILKKGLYDKVVKFKDLKPEDIVGMYKVTGLTKSQKMVTDSIGTHPEATTQWFILFKMDGKPVGFWTAKDPEKSTKQDLANLMSSGIHQGDDDTMNAKTESDVILAPRAEENIEIADEF